MNRVLITLVVLGTACLALPVIAQQTPSKQQPPSQQAIDPKPSTKPSVPVVKLPPNVITPTVKLPKGVTPPCIGANCPPPAAKPAATPAPAPALVLPWRGTTAELTIVGDPKSIPAPLPPFTAIRKTTPELVVAGDPKSVPAPLPPFTPIRKTTPELAITGAP